MGADLDKIKLFFKLYSLLFYTPSQDLIEEAKSIAIALSEKWIIDLLDNTPLEKLRQEYTKTFSIRGSCRPYESYYREGLVYGNTSVEIKKYYESKGYTIALENELPDHISVELEYLSLSLDKFFMNRFKEWFALFVKDLEKCSNLYHKLALRLLEELEKLN